ncbi:hypothetical protein U9M48_027741 [Paspalum notatum var. saurae]|uniref:CCHC-type domain-containing protein n=1 Tax=Paspalum notatum var. saurae TaxID=547442 RepID=A0AAQ3TTI2_PASNO
MLMTGFGSSSPSSVYYPNSLSNRRLTSQHSVYMVPRGPGVLHSWQCNQPGTRSRGMSFVRLFGLTISRLALSSSSNEIRAAFIRPSRYSPKDVNTDPRRATRLLDGFDPTWPTHLGRGYDGFTELVDVAIDMEDRLNHAHKDRRGEKTCKHTSIEFLSAATGCASSFITHTLPRHAPATRTTPGNATTLLFRCTTSSAASMPPAKQNAKYPCYNCGKTGHFSKNCFARRRSRAPLLIRDNPRQSKKKGPKRDLAPTKGRVHYTHVDRFRKVNQC